MGTRSRSIIAVEATFVTSYLGTELTTSCSERGKSSKDAFYCVYTSRTTVLRASTCIPPAKGHRATSNAGLGPPAFHSAKSVPAKVRNADRSRKSDILCNKELLFMSSRNAFTPMRLFNAFGIRRERQTGNLLRAFSTPIYHRNAT
jgi:hypothetical protein